MENSSDVQEKYDAIIIGAGIGGLFCANYLSLRNKKVLIVEQHRTPGGYVCGFKRGKYYFDGANNSLSSHGIVFGLLKEIGIDKRIKFHPYEMCHVVKSANLVLRYDNMESVSKTIIDTFKDEKNIEEFVHVLNDFYNFYQIIERYPIPLLYSGAKKTLCMLRYGLVMFKKETRKCLKSVIKYGALSGEKFASTFFEKDSEAYKFFRSYGNPNQSAIVLGAMIEEFIKDKWYPEGGEQHFADVIADSAIEIGTRIMYNTLAVKVLTEGKKAIGVETTKGKFYAENIIFDSDYKKMFLEILDNKELLSNKFLQRLHKAQLSDSLFTVFLGIKYDQKELRKRIKGLRMNYSRVIVPKDTDELVDDPEFFKDITISIFSPSVVEDGITPEGYSSVILQCMCSGKWMNNWGNGDKIIYNNLKEKVTDQIMELFDEALPELVDKVEYMESATPKTYERYTLNSDGAFSAWSWVPKKSFFNNINVNSKTPIKNLYCCSAWSYKIGGMVSTMISARDIAKRHIK